MSLFRRVFQAIWPKRREETAIGGGAPPETPVTSSDASLDWTLPNRQLHFSPDARQLAFTLEGAPLAATAAGKRLAYTVPARRLEYTLEVVR